MSYSHDPAGNVTRVSDSVSSDTQCFRADYLRRLTEAWTPASGDCAADPTVAGLGGPSKYWQSFSYNVAGDREKLVERGTSAGDRTVEYTPTPGKHSLASTVTTDSAGSRKASYTYDEAGNTRTRPSPSGGTQTMTWDNEGHVATTVDESGESSYVYDADGNRLVRRDPAGRTLYLPGQELRYTASSGAKNCTRYYTHAGQTIAMRTSTGITWMSSDQHGTAQNTINALNQVVSTRRMLPFGEVRGGTGTWPARLDKGFVGGTLDNTGLTHIGAREYDPAIGRFISVDPLMDIADPQQWNAYSYSNNSPITFSDPTGLMWSCPDGDCRNNGPSGGGRGVPVHEDTTKNHGYGIVETRDEDGNVSINGYQLPANAPSAERLVRGMIARIKAEGAYFWAPDPDGQLDLIKTLIALESACFELGSECNDPDGQTYFYHRLIVAGIEHGFEFTNQPTTMIGGVARRYNSTNLAQAGVPFCKNSFTGDTQVLMEDGSTKRIDEIEVGDEVLAVDPETGESGAREVAATIIGQGIKHLVEIEVGGGKIVATDLHPFWLAGEQRWADAKDLRVGSVLQTSARTWVQVTAVKKRIAIKRVHNLTVDDIHTYHVVAGGTPVLVHNCSKPGPKPHGTGPHNLKIAEIASEITDGEIIAGGQILPERAIDTPGGKKTKRRPDILVKRPDGSLYGINVGKQTKRTGAPIKREAEAIEDLESVGIEMHFVPYN